jgi:hypothetical protein
VIVLILLYLNHIAGEDRTYLAKMHSSPYGTSGDTDDELITMAHNVCGAFDRARTVQQILSSFWGLTPPQEGYLMGAAVSVYCPNYWNAMASEFNAMNGY